MPNRIIKDSIHTSETVNAMSDFQFRLWVNLIAYVDDYGRGDARPAVIKGVCFPLRSVSASAISSALSALARVGGIVLYTVDGRPYLCFPNWERHQTIRNRRSKFPAPPTDENGNLQAIECNCLQLNANVPVIQSNPIQTESESESESNPTAQTDFDEFWKVYPKKVGKIAAEKAFSKIDTPVQTLIDAVNRQKRSRQWKNQKYIPNPTTWLNRGGWEDELEMDSSATPTEYSGGDFFDP